MPRKITYMYMFNSDYTMCLCEWQWQQTTSTCVTWTITLDLDNHFTNKLCHTMKLKTYLYILHGVGYYTRLHQNKIGLAPQKWRKRLCTYKWDFSWCHLYHSQLQYIRNIRLEISCYLTLFAHGLLLPLCFTIHHKTPTYGYNNPHYKAKTIWPSSRFYSENPQYQ